MTIAYAAAMPAMYESSQSIDPIVCLVSPTPIQQGYPTMITPTITSSKAIAISRSAESPVLGVRPAEMGTVVGGAGVSDTGSVTTTVSVGVEAALLTRPAVADITVAVMIMVAVLPGAISPVSLVKLAPSGSTVPVVPVATRALEASTRTLESSLLRTCLAFPSCACFASPKKALVVSNLGTRHAAFLAEAIGSLFTRGSFRMLETSMDPHDPYDIVITNAPDLRTGSKPVILIEDYPRCEDLRNILRELSR